MYTKMVKPLMGQQTYMGVIVSEYPVRHGNRFWLEGCQCTNMNAENFKEWVRINPDVDEILVEFGERTCQIIDERIDKSWMNWVS